MKFRATLATRAATGSIALCLGTIASAQTAQPVTQDQVNKGQPVKPAAAAPDTAQQARPDSGTAPGASIVVTGSRIRGIAPVGSNVIAIDQTKIEQEPVISTNDLLRRVPQVDALGANRQGGTAQNAAANATRGAGINLRGIGTNATLLLYDGERFPPQGTQGQYTDPSVLPAIALSRVEVVADGASAIYGSDAIAGVVNFILRKNFDGIELRARSGFTDGNYKEQQLAGIIGQRWDGGSAMIAAEYTHNNALFGSDLDFYNDNNVYRGGHDLRTTFCDPGTISVGGSTYAIPAGGVTSATASALVRGTSNKCFYNGQDTVIPNQKRYNVVGNFSQQIGPVRIFGNGFWSKRDGVIASIANVSAVVPSTNPFFVAPVGVTPALCAASVGVPAGTRCETVTWSMVPELGETYNPYLGKSWNVMAGAEARPFGDWRVSAYYAHGQSEDINDRTLGLNAANLAAALRNTNAATALNVFGTAPNNPATLASLRDQLFDIIGRTKLDVVNAQADGSLLTLPGGNVRLAFGGEYRREYTFTDLVTGSSTSQLHTADGGARNIKAAFGELFVPIFGASNAMPGIRELSLSLAGRYEHYSDFGSTSNPKLGFTYRPFDGLKIRGSYGTSFRAPTFVERSTIAGGAGLYYDTLPGPNGSVLTGIGIAGGNPNLKPETARTWSIGGEFSPKPIPGLVATLTYWDINYKNQIQALRGTAGLLTNPLYASFVQFNPTLAQVQALINSGLPINSAINPNIVQFIDQGQRQNLGQSLISGIDFGVNYSRDLGAVKIDGGFQGTYYTRYEFAAVPGAALTNVLGTINFPQKFRSQADVGLKFGPFSTRVTWNHLAGYLNTTVTPVQHVNQYNTIDLYAGWDINKRFNIAVDVRNLFDKDPPFVDITRGYDPQAANPVPRLISVTAGLKFQ